MERWKNLVSTAGLLLAVAVVASGREWTDITGTYKTEADLVEVRGTRVVLKKPNGQIVSLPIDRLSKSDQEYLASLENLEPKPKNAATAATETITNSIGMQLKLISPGEFVMGSPEAEEKRDDRETQHRVQITRSFYMGVTEVTQHQWLSVMRTRPWRDKTSLEAQHLRVTLREKGDHPAINLSWEDAVLFCNQLSDKERLSPCYEIKALASAAPGDRQTIGVEFLPQGTGYRLPTEAEWEYACRAGTTTAYSFGDDKSKLKLYAWYEANSSIPSGQPVGTKLPNPWGLHDMHGSVYEWCRDWGGDYDPADVTDPTGPVQGTVRVCRGGCAGAADSCCRSAFRLGMYPTNRQHTFGMRVVRIADPQLTEQEPPKPIAKEPPIPPLPPPAANDAPKPARDFKPDRMVTFQIYGLGHARQMAGQVRGQPIWGKVPCFDCINEIFPMGPFDGALNKVEGLKSREYEAQADPKPLRWTAEIDYENTDLGEIGKAILQANTPHRTAKQLYLELPAKLNPNSARTALGAIDKLKGVVQGGSKAVPRSADSHSEKILVRISGLESLTLADILAALKAAGNRGRAEVKVRGERCMRTSYRRVHMSGLLALATAILLARQASGARLLQVYVERDGTVVLHSYYEDGGRADAATVWRYLQRPPIMVDDHVTNIEIDADTPLEAPLEGDLLLRIQHVERIIAQARLSTLALCREHEQTQAWFLPVAEVERTAAAAGLGPPPMRLTSVAWRFGLAAVVAVALLFAVGLAAKALLSSRQFRGPNNG